jgi:hypothetical protein
VPFVSGAHFLEVGCSIDRAGLARISENSLPRLWPANSLHRRLPADSAAMPCDTNTFSLRLTLTPHNPRSGVFMVLWTNSETCW